MIKSFIFGLLSIFCVEALAATNLYSPMTVYQLKKISLGKLIFNDASLSDPAGKSCGSCHNASTAYADGGEVVSASASGKLFGARNTPSIAYVKFNPVLHWDFEEKRWVGGFSYDGSLTNLQSQAAMPFTNPLKMSNKSFKPVVDKVARSPYADMAKSIYGKDVFSDVDRAMDAITDAIVSYEVGPDFSLFSSKYDSYLQGKEQLSDVEQQGLKIFEDENKGNCTSCHTSQSESVGKPPLFTNYTYHNIGLAKPDELKFYQMKEYNRLGDKFVDKGLAENPNIHDNPDQLGKFKVPTLRNIALTAPYMHNGMFKDLKQVVQFYNTRDVDSSWGKPEISSNVDKQHLGNLKLTDQEVDAVVAFLLTLTDGYKPSE